MRTSAHLSCHRDLCIPLKPYWTRCAVGIVEDYRDAGLGNTCLPALVDEVLLVLRSHLETGEHIQTYKADIGSTHR